MHAGIFVFILFLFRGAVATANGPATAKTDPRSQQSNCSTIRLRGSYVPDLTGTYGAAFQQMGVLVNDRNVYQFDDAYLNESFYVFYDKEGRWNVGLDYTNSTLVNWFANSSADHPVDVASTWQYTHGNGSFSSNSSFDCATEPNRSHAPSTCKKVKLLASETGTVIDKYIDKTFVQSHYALNGRPVFKYQKFTAGATYLYFVNSSWILGSNFPLLRGIAYVKSNAMHPADVKSIWSHETGGRPVFRPFEKASFSCDNTDGDDTSNCTAITVIQPKGVQTKYSSGVFESIVGKTFRTVNVTDGKFPLFELSLREDGPNGLFIRHEFFGGGLWMLYAHGSVPLAFSLSRSLHPADSTNPWYAIPQGHPVNSDSITNSKRLWNFEVVCDYTARATHTSKLPYQGPLSKKAFIAVTVACISVIGVLVAGYIWKPRFLMKRRNRIPYNEQDLDHLRYDVFICYKCFGLGQTFAREVLYPRLADEWNLSVALDAKDFLPGTPIDENILRVMGDSRRVMLVLTEDFLESGWCKLETSCALHQMASGATQIIPVLLEDVRNSSSLDYNIQYILSTVTYLPVPERQSGDDMEKFWKHLRGALPTPEPRMTDDEAADSGSNNFESDCGSNSEPPILYGSSYDITRLQLL